MLQLQQLRRRHDRLKWLRQPRGVSTKHLRDTNKLIAQTQIQIWIMWQPWGVTTKQRSTTASYLWSTCQVPWRYFKEGVTTKQRSTTACYLRGTLEILGRYFQRGSGSSTKQQNYELATNTCWYLKHSMQPISKLYDRDAVICTDIDSFDSHTKAHLRWSNNCLSERIKYLEKYWQLKTVFRQWQILKDTRNPKALLVCSVGLD